MSKPKQAHRAGASQRARQASRSQAANIHAKPTRSNGSSGHAARSTSTTRAPIQRRRSSRRAWWQGPTPIVGAVVAIVAIIALFIALSNRGGTTAAGIGQAVPPAVMRELAQVDPKVLAEVKTGALNSPLTAEKSTPVLKSTDGKPRIVYIGAEYCPYCAAQRWSLIVALSRFGTFGDLKLSMSSSTDTFANTNTFTFVGSTYNSTYVDFAPVETADREQKPLQTPTAEQRAVLAQFSPNGGIPLTSVANQYVVLGSGFDPALIQGATWEQIAAKLGNSQDPVARGILGNANYLTAAICKVTNDEPNTVCKAAPIPEMEQQLTNGR